MMANTQGSRCFLNNGELYIGDPVSARKTVRKLSAQDDNLVTAAALNADKTKPALAFTETSFSLSTKLVDKYVN
ncbi:MAG: hypothetical protein HZC23_04790 [Rhodocyclales bacterium]|nr:hypothetical protein [Rhodocyclales bacterium]